MDELRLSLAALFVALIAGIYIRERWYRQQQRARAAAGGDAAAGSYPATPVAMAGATSAPFPEAATTSRDTPAPAPARQRDVSDAVRVDNLPDIRPGATSTPAQEPDPLFDPLLDATPRRELERDGAVLASDPSTPAYLAEPAPDPYSQLTGRGMTEHAVEAPDDAPQVAPSQGAHEFEPGHGLLDEAQTIDAVNHDALDIPLGNIDLLSDEPTSEPVYEQGQLAFDSAGESATGAPPRNDGAELIVVMHVMRPNGPAIDGAEVRKALELGGLRLGEMDIYHHFGVGDAGHHPVFSVAKAVEPGTFNPDDDDSYETPGLTLFMRLPGVQDGTVILELMFAAAQSLARRLDAQILDERRSTLSAQALNHLRDQVLEFGRQQRLSAR